MAGHLFTGPVSAPTVTLELSPAVVMVHEQQIVPIQRLAETEVGSIWVYELSSNRRQYVDVVLDNLPETDWSGYAGFATFASFLRVTLNFSAETATFTHTDGDVLTLRYHSGLETCREGQYQRWSGTVRFAKVL